MQVGPPRIEPGGQKSQIPLFVPHLHFLGQNKGFTQKNPYTFMKMVTLFAPSLMNWVGICPSHISPVICSISYGVRCICGAFPHNYRQNNDGENWIIAWSSALILTRMDISLRPGLPTSNLAQPSQIRSFWDIFKEWISLAWSRSAVLLETDS